ncbi:MAG: NTP transferase domain-containing protein [Gemmatimonadetes bacterium]|nr:NTP transferase domain-containing protein [Gemmatimonadota bacterium]
MHPSLVILAAGLSRRYGPLKQLAPAGPGGEALLDYTLYDAARAGFAHAVFVVSDGGRDEVKGHVERLTNGVMKCTFTVQRLTCLPAGFASPADRVRPWGTGHALLAAESVVDGPFLVLNADDFYGRGTIEAMAAHLQSVRAGGATDFAMPAYRLDRTLASSGGVSRAICEVAPHGQLTGVQELLDVRCVAGATHGRPALGGNPLTLSGDEQVSMNIWALTPRIFPLLRDRLSDFLDSRCSDPDAEFYLSAAIDALIRAGSITVRVIPTQERPFGVTFAEDLGPCAQRIEDLISRGEYPLDLATAFAGMAAHNAQESTCG